MRGNGSAQKRNPIIRVLARVPLPLFDDEIRRHSSCAISISGSPCAHGRESVRGLLLAPYFAAGAVRGTTKETGDRYRPLLRTHCEKFAHSRCISADLRNPQELKRIRAKRPLHEGSVITSHAIGVWRLFDRLASTVTDCAHCQYELSQRISFPGPNAISRAGP